MKQPRDKLPYSTPKLVIYGDIRTITQTLGTTSAKNDGGSGSSKTA